MKTKYITLFISLILGVQLSINCRDSLSQNNGSILLDLTGPYLGQEPPGMTPKVFAKEIFSGKKLHSSPSFSPNGTEVYWAENGNLVKTRRIYFMKMINNTWTKPAVASFSGNIHGDNPVFSPDGQKLFFNSFKIINGSEKERIWLVERKSDGSWALPNPIDEIINNYALHWQISVDSEGTIYYGSSRNPNYGPDDIFCSKTENGRYRPPVNLGDKINSSSEETMPYIDPERRFIIFCRPRTTSGDFFPSFWVSKRSSDGSWNDPVNISLVHSGIQGICPQITPDGKYLIYHSDYSSGETNVFWVDAKCVYELIGL